MLDLGRAMYVERTIVVNGWGGGHPKGDPPPLGKIPLCYLSLNKIQYTLAKKISLRPMSMLLILILLHNSFHLGLC